MAFGADDSQKTEQPTQRRLSEARDKGRIAASRDVNHWFMILAATVVVAVVLPPVLPRLQITLAAFLDGTYLGAFEASALRDQAWGALRELGWRLVPAIGILVLAAAGAGFLQAGPLWTAEPLKPKLEKVSPVHGLKRIFSLAAVVEFAKSLAKILVVGTVAWYLLRPELDRLDALVGGDMRQILGLSERLTLRVMAGVLAVLTAVAAADLLYQKLSHLRGLRMTRHEVRDEYRQTEGDPVIKRRLKQLRLERARRRIVQEVPKADVVITNPTHYAVALRYDMATMAAPKMVAKGADLMAQRIRQVAAEHKVPVVENPPLAQALYAGVEIDHEVPPEHYKAVAEVISYVMRLKRGREPG
ncbi:MAG: flagellar biosynthesis protein FlhB [Pseudomonadota bacterium]